MGFEQAAALLRLLSVIGSNSLLASPPEFPHGAGPSQAWNSSAQFCDWVGVKCCSEISSAGLALCSAGPESVAQLLIADANLSGRLPDVFASLPDLQILDLSSNPGNTTHVSLGHHAVPD
jgi:hypothetical protein